MTANEIPRRSRREKGTLGILLLSGPVTWSIYFLLGYMLVEASCASPFLGGSIGGLRTVSAVIIILTLLALGLTFYAGQHAYRRWQSEKTADEDLLMSDLPAGAFEGRPDNTFDEREGLTFVMISALSLNALFFLVILLT
ncbi:MAG TPA: hypothetical protein VLS48_03975, partial [Anaerolineales bacterium]|nr:hypothetical protein [Anaerolineales bacterium]